MSVSRILELRTQFETAAGGRPGHRVRLSDTQVHDLVSAASADDTDGVNDAEAVLLDQIRDSFTVTRAARREISDAIAPALARANERMRTAVAPGEDLPPEVDLRLSGLPVTSYAMPESSYAPLTERGARLAVDWRHPDSRDPAHPLGLRIIPMRRADVATELARSALVQTGDVILTVRPEWAGTGPYPAAQMGISHAGFAAVRGGMVTNVDMPLDAETTGNGHLDSPHYREASMLHIMRPRGLTADQQRNLREWVRIIRERMTSIYPSRLTFNPDYGAPNFRTGEAPTFVERLGRLALGLPVEGMTSMYCSEFAWAMLALRDVNPNDPAVRRGDFSAINPIFEPAPLLGTAPRDPDGHSGTAGLADGPALLADLATTTEPERDALVDATYVEGDLTRMSSGHRTVAANMRPLFDKLHDYFDMVDDSDAATAVLDYVAAGANGSVLPNYSPAYYFINALLPDDARLFDYVGTVVFTD